MKALKATALALFLVIGLSSCIVTSPGYGPRRGGPGWHRGHGGGHYHGHHHGGGGYRR